MLDSTIFLILSLIINQDFQFLKQILTVKFHSTDRKSIWKLKPLEILSFYMKEKPSNFSGHSRAETMTGFLEMKAFK